MKPSFFKINRHDPRTLSWWYSNRLKIDMHPSYQRQGRLWSISDKAYLIDSILNGFDIPEIYLADFQYRDTPLNKNRLPYAIIDGKQRFEAVFDFFDDKFPLNKDFVWREDSKLPLAGEKMSLLKRNYPEVASVIENASWDVMSVIPDNEEDINNIFVRLNRSRPLTGAEVRKALVGEVPDQIRFIASHEFFSETINFSTVRAENINAASKILITEYNDRFVDTKKRDLDKFARLMPPELDQQKLELSTRRAWDTLDLMTEVFLPRDKLISSSGILPVYYVFVRENALRSEKIRPFLEEFDISRRKYKKDLKYGTEPTQAGINLFEELSRNANDESSFKMRYVFLQEMFDVW